MNIIQIKFNNQKKTIEEMGLMNGSKITIIDTKDIIGA